MSRGKTQSQIRVLRSLRGASVLLTLTLALSFSPDVLARKGGNSSGGGGPNTVLAGAIKLLIEGGGLKRALLNYLETLNVDKVEDAATRGSLGRMMAIQALITDVQVSKYVEATPGHPCVDAYDNSVPASTLVGVTGSEVCFDIPKLVDAYKTFTDEEMLIRLASLAVHEHVHHFQHDTLVLQEMKANEEEADRVAGYVLMSAKFVQLPVLEWAPNAKRDTFGEIRRLNDLIRAKEAAFLSVPATDYAGYPNYIGKEDRGLFRLLPPEIYQEKLVLNGSGAYYSFMSKSHHFGNTSQIALSRGRLEASLGGCNFGMFVDLGTQPLQEVTEQTPGVKFLSDFKTFDKNEEKIRRQQSAVGHGFKVDDHYYLNSTTEIKPGRTFAYRVVIFNYADELVALKVVKVDQDGSATIAWKRLKSYPIGSCSAGYDWGPPDITGGRKP